MKTAMLILDMLNHFDFDEGAKLKKHATPIATSISRLKRRAKRKNIPVIYVNDNFGNWKFSSERIVKSCMQKTCLGRDIALQLQPQNDDYFILKPKHSGFYSTSLESLLNQLEIDRLILTGIAGNICVLFTAHDAHMRNYSIAVPRDCIASNTPADNEYALRQFKKVFAFQTTSSRNLRI